MPLWSSQRYIYEARKLGIAEDIIEAAVAISERIQAVDARLPIVLTLRHLSQLSDSYYGYLRAVVSRTAGDYKKVTFKKKVPGRVRYREIHIPEPPLLEVQRWIASNILRHTRPHDASFAFHPDSHPIYAAQSHCPSRWLLKVDLKDFFHSINERMVYDAFKELGYTKLLSFEMARICTIQKPTYGKRNIKNASVKWTKIKQYQQASMGFLPQGAPTSPMLSNLVMKSCDEDLCSIASERGFIYSRYADDLAFSTKCEMSRGEMKLFRRDIYSILSRAGFRLNLAKTVIRGPGSRRIVLGLLVDGSSPKLSKEYRSLLEQHLYYLCSPKHGPSNHAIARGMSISTMYHHVRGKIAWAQTVDPDFGLGCLKKFQSIQWPPIDSDRG